MESPTTSMEPGTARPKFFASLYWFCSDTYELTRRSILHILRSLDQVLSLVMFPIMFMLLNRYVLGGAIDTGAVSYANYLFSGIFVQTLAFGANYTTINMVVDLKDGVVDRFRTLPMSDTALLLGHVIADLIRNLISAVLIIFCAFFIGFRPIGDFSDWMMVLLLSVLFSLAISWVSAIMGVVVKSLEAAQWSGFVVIFPLTFISSSFVPTHTMPSALRVFAENQPLTHTMDAVRAYLVGTELGSSAILSIVWSLVLIAIAMPLSVYLFHKISLKR